MRIFTLIFILFFFIPCLVSGQNLPAQDSLKVYKTIENFARKSRFTKFIHGLVFKPVPITTTRSAKKQRKKIRADYYKPFEGRVIRNIHIVTLDPFGNSVSDTSVAPEKFILKAGNALHNKTADVKIKNLLLFEENDRFDSLLVRDSERLIRSQRYIREVKFFPSRVKGDSVDIYIRVLDVWSLIIDGSVTTKKLAIDLTERNFMGLGHRASYSYDVNYVEGYNTHELGYLVPNIRNTFISTNLRYFIDANENVARSISVDRPFYSAYAKWAGGIYIAQQLFSDSVSLPDSARIWQDFNHVHQDYWAGKAWQIFKGRTEDDRSTNLILSGRYTRTHFNEKPPEVNDTLGIYADDNFYMGGIGISMRKYVQDKYIFHYGITEDVPVGKTYGIVSGYNIKGDVKRWYLGMKIAWGNYYRWGYFSSFLEYGTFMDASVFEQGVFTAGANYFTGLFEVGKWKFRQFIKPELTLGINRFPFERLTLNDETGIRGFNSDILSGSHRILITFQSQTYAPWSWLGFKFGPYFVCALGMLGDETDGFRNSRLYSQFGLGVLVRNEYLVFNTFQISMAFYPVMPGNGNNVFKVNPVKTTDFGFRDFDFSKPAMLIYQ